ncbi:MAG: asparagine synthase (glutamine-hydrolyzing) [Alphaproteobacteria bacterium]
MCGIAGFIARPGHGVPKGLAERLSAALAHRGPDGVGARERDGVLLVHRRLAIIDLAGGAQPIVAPDQTAIVANAEIYDYIEQRHALAGIGFATDSDNEVPLQLYRRDGVGFAESLRGMYALAIHDPGRNVVVLARDAFGIKPLYTAETAAGFAFASEPGALIAAGLVPAREAAGARDELLGLRFTIGEETALAGIRRVAPGETIVVSAGAVVERRRRAALLDTGLLESDEVSCLRRLDAALVESVALHCRADVPFGLFLSGGVDSTSVLAAMVKGGLRPAAAFTVTFDDTAARDEADAAKSVARRFGVRHLAVPFGERDFWALLPRVVEAMDDPAADYAAVPTFKLAEAAARELKVVLTGEGGDELFAGYGRYRGALRPWWLGGRTPRRRALLDGLGLLRSSPATWRDGLDGARALAGRPGRTALQTEQALDIAAWLPNDLLLKIDRCLMAHGLEGRTPFLDPVVAELAFRLPDSLKVRGRVGKWLLRRWLAEALPESRPFAAKRGFTVPAGAWIARHGARLGPLVAAEPGVAAVCRPDRVMALFGAATDRRRGAAAWTLLFYALWHRRHVQGRRAEGDAFDALAGAG